MSKKLFLSSLAMAVALPAMVAPVQAQEVKAEVSQSFTDVSENHWAHNSIVKMRDAGIIQGYPNNTYKPNNAISRVHTASLFSRSLDLKPIRPGKEFTDVPKISVYYDQIQAVYRAGIFDGNTDGTFGINDNLTRAQMAKVMVIAFDLDMHKGYIFDDVSEKNWAKDYIASLYMSGITVGSNGKFMPNQSVSRAHYAAFLDRALNPESAPKPEKPLQTEPPKVDVKPKPQPQPQPKPKPEPKPDTDAQTDQWGNPKLKNPSGLPSGASKYDDKIATHFYNYNRSLSTGSVKTVEAHSESGGMIIVKGNDNDGKAFIALYSPSSGSMSYLLNTSPKLTDSDKNILYEIGRSFANAYGM